MYFYLSVRATGFCFSGVARANITFVGILLHVEFGIPSAIRQSVSI